MENFPALMIFFAVKFISHPSLSIRPTFMYDSEL